ncbi:MAG: hypothetical protein CBC46_07735 [Verrucomicrobiaceae bacterium TMED86]|jgi:hypothetical protein|nr:MAG: hypothetical protein CBC46_07735 [Verrucomicrobiaceae bacterium TMED86]
MTEKAGKNLEKDPEVVQKASRRRFTAEYKRRIALEAEQCVQPGEIGALLLARIRRSNTRVLRGLAW